MASVWSVFHEIMWTCGSGVILKGDGPLRRWRLAWGNESLEVALIFVPSPLLAVCVLNATSHASAAVISFPITSTEATAPRTMHWGFWNCEAQEIIFPFNLLYVCWQDGSGGESAHYQAWCPRFNALQRRGRLTFASCPLNSTCLSCHTLVYSHMHPT